MAKRKISQRKATTTVVVRAPARRTRSAPIVVAAPRSVSRRRRSGGGGRGGGGKEIVASVIAGAAIGIIEKQSFFASLPSIPLLGKKGTIAVLAYLWRRNGGPEMARDVALVAAGLSGYQFSKDGRIDGDDDE
jgi:hypothetical protein